ncbi:YqeG family HAD IIIA-type phosphatase [Sporolactobacillus shoreicorticis]|uniref:YqeG family HAD IIIA-type phosphatase n=1 Tax=Sporolactobacillus shoreicorticis TaxID=1923877 RepID=A0ABW5S5V6_9BACL|nr:YqeG family HAD IIIA-type phosphatase [Sporolactobacillus shoreicorticis]MCO7126364.1 YqeG family HAD IIIA-type phosphatase [Sporolactobacillus shoreicorticis]
MLRKFLPDEHVESILDIKPDKLRQRGVKALVTDLDNTLIAWNEKGTTPQLVHWFSSLKKVGISVMILSNNSEKRVKLFSDSAGVSYIYRARKPLPFAFRRAMRIMKVTGDEMVVVGDQLMTDVLGGNQVGAHTILVTPIASTDGWATKMNRHLERFILSLMRRKGWLKWEE